MALEECLPFHFKHFIFPSSDSTRILASDTLSLLIHHFQQSTIPAQLDISRLDTSIHLYSWVLTWNWCSLSIILTLMQCSPWPLLTVWFLPQWGQLSQILHPNSSSVRWMTLNMSVCFSMCVPLSSETFVHVHQCVPVCLCICNQACCVMRPSPVFSCLCNYTAGQWEPSVVSTVRSV